LGGANKGDSVLNTMILSDRDIQLRLLKGDLQISPLDDPVLQIQPASVDLRLGDTFIVYQLHHVACIDSRDPDSITRFTQEIKIEQGKAFILHPGEFALGSTVERVKIPADLVARVEGRSSIGRLAIVVHATAGFIDPGFEGEITLELSNLGRCPVMLYPGMRISQVVFHTMVSPAERPYGTARGSKYQGQAGPVSSRMGTDRPMRKGPED
jgi:dCTP deaminase